MAKCCFNILLLEDNNQLCDLLKYVAEDLGITVFTAGTTEQAIEILSKNKSISFGFIDFHVPGSQNTFELKNNPFIEHLTKLPNFEFVFATGDSNLDLKSAKGLGAINVIHKPFVSEDMQAILKSYLKIKGPKICRTPNLDCPLLLNS